MVKPLRHRQTKGAANRYAQPNATAPHSYSTHSGRTPRRFGRAALRQCYAREVNTLIPVFARRRTYMCEADATAAGNRAAKNEKRP